MLRRPRRWRRWLATVRGLFFGVLLLVGGGTLFYTLHMIPRLKVRASLAWPEARCHILSAQVVEETDSEGDTRFRPALAYRYEVQGRLYSSRQINFGATTSTSSRRFAQAVLAQYTKGSDVPCYYDPADPRTSVLVRSAGRAPWYGLIGLAMALFGIALAIQAIANVRRGLSPEATGSEDGLVQLQRHGPSGNLVGLLMRGGLALGFTPPAVLAWSSSLFWSIVLGALALILHLWFWHGLLQRVSPRVEVFARHPARLGQPVYLEISLRGFMPMRRVQARVVGREEASHTVGTDTVTDTATFFEHPLQEVSTPGRTPILRGRVTLPEASLPTFHAQSNHVRWVVAVNAVIPMWPDVDFEYELEVRPAKANHV